MAEENREELEKKLEGVKGLTLPVNVTIEAKQRVLNVSELEEILKKAEIISQGQCHCRIDKGDDKCADPMDGCFGLDDFAREGIEKYGEKAVSLEEALEAMKRTYDAGFVHMAYAFKGRAKPDIVCSCCTCCCELLSVAAKIGYSDHIFESRYVSTYDEGMCRLCGTCVDRCQFGARTIENGRLAFDEDGCFGCGVCVNTCPGEAIALAERPTG